MRPGEKGHRWQIFSFPVGSFISKELKESSGVFFPPQSGVRKKPVENPDYFLKCWAENVQCILLKQGIKGRAETDRIVAQIKNKSDF